MALQIPFESRDKHPGVDAEQITEQAQWKLADNMCAGIATKMPPLPADRTLGQKPSIWVSINEQVGKYKPLNLGQGFPDIRPKKHVLESLKQAAIEDCDPSIHQCTRSQGHPRLIRILAKFYTPFTQHDASVSGQCSAELESGTFSHERKIDAEKEVIVSVGAYGALSSAFAAIVNPGDEVIIIEPAFDCYTPMTRAVGGIPVYTPLEPPQLSESGCCSSGDWTLNFADLQSKITAKTKVLVLNTPNNPLGKVFSLDELQKIADICIHNNIICFADEVYEWVVFPPHKHIKIASLPGMWERTLTVGSAGKTFNVTGWKTGWTIGPENLISAMERIQQHTQEACSTPLQEALALCLEHEILLLNTPASFFVGTSEEVMGKMHILGNALRSVGMLPVIPQGGYFLMANIEDISLPPDVLNRASGEEFKPRDQLFNEWMMREKKLCAIPPSVFYCRENQSIGEKYLRFCIIKDDKTLEKAVEILKQW